MRGNHLPVLRLSLTSRSIPACAGEPTMPAARSATQRVYPRVCGGTGYSPHADWDERGLSPRVRGNLGPEYRSSNRLWSIPACAGEPGPRPMRSGPTPVYPRVYGGTPSRRSQPTRATGLSPRVRGNRRLGHSRRVGDGSIPACTGEPPCRTPDRATRPVYPRVYGGTDMADRPPEDDGGLSPRVRGNHSIRDVFGLGRRSIPACTGEP